MVGRSISGPAELSQIDYGLTSSFSNLNVSQFPIAEIADFQDSNNSATEDAASSSWVAQDTSFSTLVSTPATSFEPHQQSLGIDLSTLQFQIDPNFCHQNDQRTYYAQPISSQQYHATNRSSEDGNASSDSASENPFKCDTCSKRYRRKCDLDKHINNHTKRRKCPMSDCTGGGAETRDLNRHLWANHSTYAMANNIPKEEECCGKCEYHGRKDNLKRHKDVKRHW